MLSTRCVTWQALQVTANPSKLSAWHCLLGGSSPSSITKGRVSSESSSTSSKGSGVIFCSLISWRLGPVILGRAVTRFPDCRTGVSVVRGGRNVLGVRIKCDSSVAELPFVWEASFFSLMIPFVCCKMFTNEFFTKTVRSRGNSRTISVNFLIWKFMRGNRFKISRELHDNISVTRHFWSPRSRSCLR